jgi:hypothetical protein
MATLGGPKLINPNDEQLAALLIVGCQAGRDNMASTYAYPSLSNKIAQFEQQHAKTWGWLVSMMNNQGFICDAVRTLAWGKKNQQQALMSIFTDAVAKKQTNMRYHFSAWSKKVAVKIEEKVAVKIEEKALDQDKSPAEHVSSIGSLAAAAIADDGECPTVAKLFGVKRRELSVGHLQHATFIVVVSALLTAGRWSQVFPEWEDLELGKKKKTKPSREFLTSHYVHLVNEDNVITEGRRGPVGLFLW